MSKGGWELRYLCSLGRGWIREQGLRCLGSLDGAWVRGKDPRCLGSLGGELGLPGELGAWILWEGAGSLDTCIFWGLGARHLGSLPARCCPPQNGIHGGKEGCFRRQRGADCPHPQGMLHPFVEGALRVILPVGCPPPLPVKFLFDLLDELAARHGLAEPDTLRSWKNNRWVGWIWGMHGADLAGAWGL